MKRIILLLFCSFPLFLQAQWEDPCQGIACCDDTEYQPDSDLMNGCYTILTRRRWDDATGSLWLVDAQILPDINNTVTNCSVGFIDEEDHSYTHGFGNACDPSDVEIRWSWRINYIGLSEDRVYCISYINLEEECIPPSLIACPKFTPKTLDGPYQQEGGGSGGSGRD